jgi:hypothetical protein
MSKKMKWDLFISHSSEDKENFVKPLATLLNNMGVLVWYDEFSLKFGDSLSRSIDKGLSNSKYGVVVISKSFMEKRWPEYELQGLITLERAGKENRIIPIWHEVSHKQVMAFSPSLADKLAGNTSRQSISEIALSIIAIVRPDIYDNLHRILEYRRMIENAKIEKVPLKEIIIPPIRHATLPGSLLVRIHIINQIFHEVYPSPLEKTINNFRRDAHPEREVQVWERIAAAYLHLTTEHEFEMEQKQEIFDALFEASLHPLKEMDFSDYHYVTPQMISEAIENSTPKIIDEEA